MRLTILAVCASISWGASFTTVRSGDWSNTSGDGAASPWCSAGVCTVPGDGDSITIANGHTLVIPPDYTATAGLNTGTDTIATPAIQTAGVAGTGRLVIRGKLIFKGPIRQGNATWEVEAGAVVSHGGATGANYTWQISLANSQPDAVLRINGTQGMPVTFTKENGADNAGSIGHTFSDAGRVQATWANFSYWGTSTTPVYVGSAATGLFDAYFRHCTFQNTGTLQVNRIDADDAKFELSRNRFMNPLASNGRAVFFGASGWLSKGIGPGGVRLIDRNVIYGQFTVSTGVNRNDFTITNNIFRNYGNVTTPLNFLFNSAVAWWQNNLIYSNAGTGVSFGGPPGGTLRDTLCLRKSDNPLSRDVDMFRVGTAMWDITLDRFIFEYQDAGSTGTVPDTGGDTYVLEGQHASVAVTHTIRNSIWLPNEDGGANGTSMVLLTGAVGDWSRTRMVLEHNTLLPTTGSEGVFKISEGTTDVTAPPGRFVYHSNLAWRTRNGPGKFFGKDARVLGYSPGLAESVNHNGRYNITGDPYSNLQTELYTNPAPPGAEDVDANPDFVDSTRNFLFWATSVDGTLRTWDVAVAAMENAVLETGRYNPNLTVTNALTWIRQGFLPRNPLYWFSGYSRTQIGAVDPIMPDVLVPAP